MDKSEWKTHCFGRYLVDLPPQANVSAAYKLWSAEIERLPDINATSPRGKIEKRAVALQGMSHDTAGSMLVRRIDHGNGSTSLLSWSSPRRTILMYEETYLATTSPSQAFKYSGDISASRQAMAVAFLNTLATNIHSRADNEIPTGPGFCIDKGFIAGNDYRSESVQVGITLPQHPNAFISFDASTGAEEDRLLERVDKFLAAAVAGPLAGMKVLRKRERNVGAIPAEEYAPLRRAMVSVFMYSPGSPRGKTSPCPSKTYPRACACSSSRWSVRRHRISRHSSQMMRRCNYGMPSSTPFGCDPAQHKSLPSENTVLP
ncbi:hypothetical protein CBM2634_A40061 [Cupriavidus taiwanensis]|uniref:Uncharacterized protein n=1 Tax=Cupriavidus taiwanensis TaxID=164546 RepID=A0A375J3M8_9BURK|nr:hypothetical protein CBM2634_A40061 [Cupriavidus taiwanensis]